MWIDVCEHGCYCPLAIRVQEFIEANPEVASECAFLEFLATYGEPMEPYE